MRNTPDLLAINTLSRFDILMFFRKELRRIVSIHTVMFEKLLSEEGDIPLELAELFEDVANTYLDISVQISSRKRPTSFKVE
ncbi:MAG TPA: hypothetical protein VHB46_00520 [Burkholderiales bacterium]|nr:hypothetical protein [Burkholderiales bacterium]